MKERSQQEPPCIFMILINVSSDNRKSGVALWWSAGFILVKSVSSLYILVWRRDGHRLKGKLLLPSSLPYHEHLGYGSKRWSAIRKRDACHPMLYCRNVAIREFADMHFPDYTTETSSIRCHWLVNVAYELPFIFMTIFYPILYVGT